MPWVSVKSPTLEQLDIIMLECMTKATNKCHYCGVSPGEVHMLGCDTARCLICGNQRISCDCPRDSSRGAGDGDVWTGLWPGTIECYEYGLVCFWEGPAPIKSWEENCGKLTFSYYDEAIIRHAKIKLKRLYSFRDFLISYKINHNIINNIFSKKHNIVK
jgi:hypothetical protein